MAPKAIGNTRVNNNDNSNKVPHPIAQIVFSAVCGAGLLSIGAAVTNSGLEWQFFSIAALAFTLGPLSAEIRGSKDGTSIKLPLVHPALFASALALGPIAAALPGAFSATARIIFGQSKSRPLSQLLYMVLKPAVVCAVTSYVYILTGGSDIMPQASDSFIPIIYAALVYMLFNALLLSTFERINGEPAYNNTATLHASTIIAAWSLCFMCGYSIAVLYAIAPAYVLLAPVCAIGFAQATLCRPKHENQEVEIEVIESNDTTEQKSEDGFIDTLTGLANHRYLTMFLNRELNRSERTKKPLSIAIFDVDGLKKSVPHAMSNVLSEVGSRLKAGLRDYDLIAIHESGRIVVALPETSAEQAYEVIERLHTSISPIAINKKTLSLSVGIATFPEHGGTMDSLINSSHRALNQGRFNGQNSVHSCQNYAKAS